MLFASIVLTGIHHSTTQDQGTKIPLDCTDITSMLLSPEKVKEREELIAQGFPGWNRSHYYSFLDGMAIYGRDRLELVAPMVRDRVMGGERRGSACRAVLERVCFGMVRYGTVGLDCSALRCPSAALLYFAAARDAQNTYCRCQARIFSHN